MPEPIRLVRRRFHGHVHHSPFYAEEPVKKSTPLTRPGVDLSYWRKSGIALVTFAVACAVVYLVVELVGALMRP